MTSPVMINSLSVQSKSLIVFISIVVNRCVVRSDLKSNLRSQLITKGSQLLVLPTRASTIALV